MKVSKPEVNTCYTCGQLSSLPGIHVWNETQKNSYSTGTICMARLYGGERIVLDGKLNAFSENLCYNKITLCCKWRAEMKTAMEIARLWGDYSFL